MALNKEFLLLEVLSDPFIRYISHFLVLAAHLRLIKMKKHVKKRSSAAKQKTKALEEDERYKAVLSDPMFSEMRRKERKVVVDDRFKEMFTDKRFAGSRAQIDKRGRPVKLGRKAGLERLYEVDEGEKASEESDASAPEDEASGSENEVRTKKSKLTLDLARGEGNLVSSSDEEAEDLEITEADVPGGPDSDWNELDKSARRVEWASRRLAICNMDWDRVRADDLLVLLSSFKPAKGSVASLGVYLSDFGAEKLAEEERHGPVLSKLGNNKEVNLEKAEIDEWVF